MPQTVMLAWLAGALVCLSYLAVLYVSLRMKLRRNAAAPSKKLIELFNEARAEMGLKANIKLICQYEYGTPSLMFPKTIMMPMDVLVAMSDEQIKFALRHELAHFRRGDHIVSMLLSLLNAVYWFNPFVWAAFDQMRKDMETACDGAVVKHLSAVARSRYASLILHLSARPSHRQLTLGMSRSRLRKDAERRVTGVFMKGKSRMSTKLITALLAIVLLFTCFTTACQPVTGEPIPGTSVGNNTSVDLNWAPKPPESYKVSEHWSENVEKDNVRIVIDADVFMPDADEYPVVRLERAGFTQQRLDELVNYFAKGKKLYLPRPMTKADYQQQINNVKQGELVNGVYVDTGWSLDDIKQLEQNMAAAPEDPPPIIYTDTTLKYAKDETGKELTEYGKNFLSVMIGNGDADDASISIWNFTDNSSANFFYWKYLFNDVTESMYQENLIDRGSTEAECGYPGAGELFGKVDITRDEAIAQADKVISGLGINGLMLVSAEKYAEYIAPGAPEQGGYKLLYSRQSGGIPLCWIEAPLTNGAEKLPLYSKPFIEEVLAAYITKDGLTCLRWIGYANVVETVSENSELMPFESIKEALKDRIFYKNSFNQEHLPSDFTVTVTSAELRMGYIGVKDNAKQGLMVPVWFFRTEETYTENGKTVVLNKLTYMLNALDGGAIESRSGIIM